MAALAVLFDKRKRAFAQAKFRAWWEGEDFDADAAQAEIDAADAPAEAAAAPAAAPEPAPPAAAPAPTAPKAVAETDLFEAPKAAPPARIGALARLWGEGRVLPGDESAEALLCAQLGIGEGGVLAVMGAGLYAPLVTLAGKHHGPIIALEWREETRASLREGLARAGLTERVTIEPADLDTYAPAADLYDGFISLDDFTYAANAPRLAIQIARAVKPGACALIETYAALQTPALPPAFASAFAEPHLRPHGDIAELFTDAGMRVEASEDQSEEHLALGRAGFKRLEGVLAAAVSEGIDVAVMREIAWEAEAWRARMKLLAQKRLERRMILVRKPAA